MASSNAASTFEMDQGSSRGGGNTSLRSKSRIPRSWVIAAVIFYCASLLTVGLLVGLLPRRTQYITIVAAPTQLSTISPVTPAATTATPEVSTTTERSTAIVASTTTERLTAIVASTTTERSTTVETSTTSSIATTTLDPSICVDDECNPRLSSDLIVKSYALQYRYNDTQHTTAQGTVTIEFTLKQPVKQLIYHAKRLLQLEPPTLFENNVNRIVSMRTYVPNDYISLRLTSNTLFPSSQYKLVQNFVVNLTDGNVGFYRSVFQDEDGSMSQLLSTQFQLTDARKAFPCFDEPHLKAVFKIKILHPENTIARANFPIIEETMVDGLRQTTFDDTFVMSTYLAAWTILPETYGQRSDDNEEPFLTVWARRQPTLKNHTEFALEIATKSVTFFSDYFGVSEPVPSKIDLLAVPSFPSGAMENWGLITFREDRLILDEKVVSMPQKQELAETIVHELAHFWFGNYVTCKWWDDLWLNEAMATWLSYKPFATNYPEWNYELQVLTEVVIPVMWDDAKPSSHPIVVKNVTNADEITSLFDSITYSKGASILRMLEKIVGSNRFRDSLREYLSINAFDVGDPTVFYDKLFSDISGEAFMKNWLEEMNYPLLNVNLKVENGDTKVVFTQSRFIISNALNSCHLNKDYRWQINVKCVLGGTSPNSNIVNVDDDKIEFMLDNELDTRVLPGKSYSWIKCNKDFQGFYVTEYTFETSTWQRFSSVLEAQPTFFSDEDKTNLMQDTFLLAYRGLVDYTEPLRIVRSLVKINIKQTVHWRTFQWHWEALANLIDYLPNTLPAFQSFAIKQILSGTTTMDTILAIASDDDHNTKLVKGLQYALLCRMNHPESIQRATTLFKSIPSEYFNNANIDTNIAADLLSTVYTYHLKNDDNDADWNMMYNYYKIAISPQEQTRALTAISSTRNRNRLNQLLNEGLAGGSNTIRRQDYFPMIKYMCHHSIGRETVWMFYRNNYEKLVDAFTLENHEFGSAIISIARSFEQDSYFREMEQFFVQYPNAGSGTLARQQALDQVKMNIEWIKLREGNLRYALDTITV